MGFKDWLEAPVSGAAVPRRPALNAVRGALTRITTPLIPDDYLHLANPLWSARELRGRIVRVEKLTDTAATLVIKPGWGFDFDYRPGQYIGIGLHVDGRWHWRSYSLTSAPDWKDKQISIAVKAMPEGFLSSHLVDGVKTGTIVRLAAPKGDFALPEPPPEKILFVTAGSGITPVIGMLRSLDTRGHMPDVVHVHSAPSRADVMFGAELEALDAKYDSVVSHVQLTRSDGKFDLRSLDERFPDWRERQTWACGPIAMLDEVEAHWADAGVADRLHTERFEIARTGASEDGGTVTFARSGRTVGVDGATTLLEAGESAGVQMPFGCRMGICQTCVVAVSDGHVRDLRSGKEHSRGERIQTCISAAAGDCTLEL
ncbi:ferredoxin reductase [Rhodococcoides corynebacterioides]|uniref:ferredoxin reductase n=1 Tax=Rhodococcoides corynebacterioides TaxID=53972 RepID=UPI001C9A68A5|nr:ferredoxin reductase [Rhodococcus corynebacterioides]MBY6349894.1 ferredoxin reductase [Rhodococcus corynebacterioides]